MGYNLHITRAPSHYLQNHGHEITADEWLEYVSKDPNLRLAGYNGKCFAICATKSGHEEPWFDWSYGNIMTKNADAPIIAKAIEIALNFHARVQGDDGEIYLPEGKVERHRKIADGPGMDWRQW